MLDEKDMATLAALLEKMKGGGSPSPAASAPAPAENDYGARIDMLAESIKVAVDGNIKLAEKVCELEKQIAVFAAFTSSWDSFAQEKDRADRILARKGKYGEKYGKFEGVMRDVEGVDIWEVIDEELEEARALAEKAGGEFNEDTVIAGLFDGLEGKIKKYHEAGGKMIAPAAVEIEVEKTVEAPAKEEPKKEEVPSDDESEIPTAEAAEELGRNVGMRARERRIKK